MRSSRVARCTTNSSWSSAESSGGSSRIELDPQFPLSDPRETSAGPKWGSAVVTGQIANDGRFP